MGKKVANKMIANISGAKVAEQLAEHLCDLLNQQEGINYRPIILLCIGSDRYTGDALGPLVGSYLLEQGPYSVYGSLEEPVHAGNLEETVHVIGRKYFHPLIVAIDACLGKAHEVGNIEVWEGGLEAGIAVGHRLPCVGDISVIGVVNIVGHYSYIELQTTSLSIVVKIRKAIAQAVMMALGRIAAQDAAASLSGLVVK